MGGCGDECMGIWGVLGIEGRDLGLFWLEFGIVAGKSWLFLELTFGYLRIIFIFVSML